MTETFTAIAAAVAAVTGLLNMWHIAHLSGRMSAVEKLLNCLLARLMDRNR